MMSIEQLQRLIHLLDRSDVSELELRRAEEGTRLVLRKAKFSDSTMQQSNVAAHVLDSAIAAHSQRSAPAAPSIETKHAIVAHLVGIFHTWARPRGGALVAVGDHVKAGQLIATIESLNIINEVESSVDGRVVEIFIQEGQPVEYGQLLMAIDSSGEEQAV